MDKIVSFLMVGLGGAVGRFEAAFDEARKKYFANNN